MTSDALTDQQTQAPQQSQAIGYLLEAPSVAEAARRSGVSRATIYNWLKKPHFRAELDHARRADHQARLNRLRSMVAPALDALEGQLKSEDERIRLRAAAEVLRAYQRLADSEPAGMPVVDLTDEEWTEATVPLLAKKCMEGLLSGTLDARSAHMAPQYLAFLERSLAKEAERKRREEFDKLDDVGKLELIVKRLEQGALLRSVLPKDPHYDRPEKGRERESKEPPAPGGPDDKPP